MMTVQFAVTGIERSGTQWLALLLDCDESVAVHHEPAALRAWDAQVFALAQAGLLDAAAFARARYNYWRNTAPHNGPCAEVNSAIRYVVGAVREAWGIPVAGLVRDGRRTVRSLYRRGTFQREGMPGFEPPAELAQDPFAACCWYWADGCERLLAQKVPLWRLEDLNQNLKEFDRLCTHLGLDVTEADWQRWAGRKVHQAIAGDGPPAWTDPQVAAFERWAGEIQRQLGYEGDE